MNKTALLNQIIIALESARDKAAAAADDAKKTATDKENIAENRYDTLGLEAAYLAHGQSNRVAEIEAELIAYQNMLANPVNESKTVTIGSIVTLEDDSGSLTHLFIGPGAGGLKFQNSREITIVTPSAPLGSAILSRSIDDSFELVLNGITKHFTIVAINQA